MFVKIGLFLFVNANIKDRRTFGNIYVYYDFLFYFKKGENATQAIRRKNCTFYGSFCE